jgi:hypothetical protein
MLTSWPGGTSPLTTQKNCYESDMGSPESGTHVDNLVLKILETR